MTASQDIFFASIAELAAGLAAKEFSAVELVRAHCDRLEKIGSAYNALALSLRQDAISQAERVDADRKRGRIVGPLQGIPYGVKDLIAVRKHPTTWGSPVFATQVFDEDARVVEKLDQAQAILIGKLSMLELAGAGAVTSTAASLTGPALNPWDRSRWAGGSSGGSAIATAAGLVTFSIGSDTIGSIITPSSFCGITGFRPTHGSVSLRGTLPLSASLDVLGPMCRSADDCALVLAAIAEDDGASASKQSSGRSLDRKASDFKIGYSPLDFERVFPPAKAGFLEGLDAVRKLGVQLIEIELPDLPYLPTVRAIDTAETATAQEEFIRSTRVDQMTDPRQAAHLKAALELPAIAYVKALANRALIQEAFRAVYERVDLILAPALSPAFPADLDLSAAAPGGGGPPKKGLWFILPAACLLGLPQISLPCGFWNGLPLGMFLTGPAWSDDQLLGIGHIFQQETDWHRRRPPVEA